MSDAGPEFWVGLTSIAVFITMLGVWILAAVIVRRAAASPLADDVSLFGAILRLYVRMWRSPIIRVAFGLAAFITIAATVLVIVSAPPSEVP